MTLKELRVIWNCLDCAQQSIENLANKNYPEERFESEEFRKMFYDLNAMGIQVRAMMGKQENNEKEKSNSIEGGK